ncbi:hypothetical protein PGTUg99_000756 [Puccinia graminis f. sp. tritici]|uniref:Uncharacterized protein n=1 Tax=Puccinia graminis f. sp. tritici TaxID=56615 RepID=A0A5B0PQQ4_PUCGR|nr:hypothetical protein PGTUg99_000756 [Puccinia graminis f. sp. tritici]
MLNSTSTQLQTQHQLNFELDINLTSNSTSTQLHFIPHSHHAHLRLRSSWIIHLHLPTGNFPRTHLEPQALLPHLAGSTSADRIDLVPPPPSRLWKTTWVDLSTLIAGLIPQPPPSSVVSPSVADPLPSSPWINHQVSRSYIISSLGSHLAAKPTLTTPLFLFLGRRPERDQPPPSSQTSPSLDQSNNRFPGVFFA